MVSAGHPFLVEFGGDQSQARSFVEVDAHDICQTSHYGCRRSIELAKLTCVGF